MRISPFNTLLSILPFPVNYFLNKIFGRQVALNFTYDPLSSLKYESGMVAPVSANSRKRKVEIQDSDHYQPSLKQQKIEQVNGSMGFDQGVEQLGKILQPQNMEIIKSVGNGNCMFNSLFQSGMCPLQELHELRVKVHNKIKSFVEGICPDKEEIEIALKEAYKNSIRFQLRQDPNLSPCEKGSLLNDVIGLDDTLSNLQERVKSNIFLKNGTYMEPVEVIFLAMVIEKPIALFDMEGHVLIVIDKEGKLFRPEIKMLENRHQLPEDTCYMFYDFNYKHYWGAQGIS